MSELKACPCGKTPSRLFLVDNGQGTKWASASGDCCGSWSVEFRTQYHALDSDKCMALAIEEWNDAPREQHLASALESCKNDLGKSVDRERVLMHQIGWYKNALSEIREIYAGMEVFKPATAPEGYLLRIIEQMWNITLETLAND